VYAREKTLQARKIRITFTLHQFSSMLLPSGVPALRNHLGRRRHILADEKREARTGDESFVLAGRQEEVETDRTTDASSSCDTRPVTTIASVNRMRPCGRNTRCHSLRTSKRFEMWHIASFERTASNLAAGNGSRLLASTVSKRHSICDAPRHG